MTIRDRKIRLLKVLIDLLTNDLGLAGYTTGQKVVRIDELADALLDSGLMLEPLVKKAVREELDGVSISWGAKDNIESRIMNRFGQTAPQVPGGEL
ncbi:hypothetical protein LCGC14_1179020 [marine sediment metagenome]|uniref:Uncharacterized protein n=1 Tax=marine sediment metagenome TaxID=412755 RepID=A0A0F9LSK5_9ZZZZ